MQCFEELLKHSLKLNFSVSHEKPAKHSNELLAYPAIIII